MDHSRSKNGTLARTARAIDERQPRRLQVGPYEFGLILTPEEPLRILLCVRDQPTVGRYCTHDFAPGFGWASHRVANSAIYTPKSQSSTSTLRSAQNLESRVLG